MATPNVYSSLTQSVRDQLQWVESVNNMIVEAERLRAYHAFEEYIRLTSSITNKVSAPEILSEEVQTMRAETSLKLARRIIQINKKYPAQSKRIYQKMKANKEKKTAAVQSCTELLRRTQTILDKHKMLLKTSQGEEGSI